jgi:hypothetical protein
VKTVEQEGLGLQLASLLTSCAILGKLFEVNVNRVLARYHALTLIIHLIFKATFTIIWISHFKRLEN